MHSMCCSVGIAAIIEMTCGGNWTDKVHFFQRSRSVYIICDVWCYELIGKRDQVIEILLILLCKAKIQNPNQFAALCKLVLVPMVNFSPRSLKPISFMRVGGLSICLRLNVLVTSSHCSLCRLEDRKGQSVRMLHLPKASISVFTRHSVTLY